jgi:dolichyl-phosphate-mannose--protein O-mannosyl transferase
MGKKISGEILEDRRANGDQSVNAILLSDPTSARWRTALIVTVLFAAAHFAFLAGVSNPDKLYFDEVHYVPAAKQMLNGDSAAPRLNPMHPPLAKQMIALSINVLGDTPLGWRYAGFAAMLPISAASVGTSMEIFTRLMIFQNWI